MYLRTCEKEASILQRSMLLRMVLIRRQDQGRQSPDGYFSVVTRESRLQEKKRDWGEKVQTIGSSWTERREKIQTEGDEEEVGGDLA